MFCPMIENDDVTLEKVVENLVDTVLAVRDERGNSVFLLPSASAAFCLLQYFAIAKQPNSPIAIKSGLIVMLFARKRHS